MKLIDLLHQRRSVAEKFTKPFQDRVETDLKFYNADSPTALDTLNVDLVESVNRRYAFNIPLLFTNHESMMSSMFDRVPEILVNQRGMDDAMKEKKVKAAYEYLKDKLDLESFMNDGAWWYILCGFSSAHIGYAQKTEDRPVLDENGEQVMGLDGKPQVYTEYIYDDPTLEVGDPKKEVYSPESEFKIDASKVPFYIRWKLITPEEIKRVYGKNVKPDSVLEVADDSKTGAKSDLERTKTYFYYGNLPKEVSGEVRGWNPDTDYMCVFTQEEVLYKKAQKKGCKIVKWHGAPNEFFGFGLGKLLRPFQREKSIRRGQMVRYADVAAYPKLLLNGETEIDKKTARDPRENLILQYQGEQKPEYLAPPNLGQVVNDTNQLADQDAQQTTGLMDISNGSQSSSTVDTATGQTIFADAAEKRVRYSKKKFMRFYREVVIELLKQAQANWQSEKMVNITDEDGNREQISVSGEDLQDIDFDLDVDIDLESVSVNKDVLREQAIALYDRAKDDPMTNRKELLKYAIEQGFDKKNPEKFIQEPVASPGTQLINPATGEQFVVDEAGNLTTPETMAQMRPPSGDGGVATTEAGLMGGVQ